MNVKLFEIVCLVSVIHTMNGEINNRINRMRGNLLQNLTRTHEYDDNIVTSQLDASIQVRQFYRSFRDVYNSWFGGTGKRDNGNFLQKRVPDTVAFPCRTNGYRSTIIPKNVNRLRPGDIDIVMAIGDSLTSATSANSAALWEVLIENRGVSWCIGGQGNWRSHLTLPNILKEFNPNLFGYSLQDSYNVHQSAQFNVAENIATVTDMPYMAQKLIDRMRLDPRVNMTSHWKLLTFMIGGNDFCSDICYQTNATQWINESQEKYLIKTLRYLRQHMPRTFVNLVPSPLVSLSFSMDQVNVPWTCYLSRPIECSCLFGPAYSEKRQLFRQREREFVKIMERVSYLKEFHTDDFTVVYQPFFRDASVFVDDSKTPDMDIMSVDCIHLSQKGHAVAANGLWNNMLERNGRKSLKLSTLFKRFNCPSPSQPYLVTYFN
ncbi:phospholipase B1, membrane-associated-like [Bradysia coprophila]|uniref:phospholipase B1, membrane-associated-like n=1 Tax=Bradysia coprophila TaxID=38358 RepID=UPI00187DA810|nr:phospholipase B1, membrane-associated-like [Bradysia coprophila]